MVPVSTIAAFTASWYDRPGFGLPRTMNISSSTSMSCSKALSRCAAALTSMDLSCSAACSEALPTMKVTREE
jgi:hypothetical protein